MARPIRYVPYSPCLVEVTAQTFQGRKLLRPSPEVNDIILGVLGRALSLYPKVGLVCVQMLSTHEHMILLVLCHLALSAFMNHVQSNIAVEVGRRIRGWTGAFWHGRYSPIPILDETSMVKRLRYLLSNGVKEGLVAKPEDWPGVSSLESLLTGQPLEGTWYDRTAEYLARRSRRGKGLDPEQFGITYAVPHVPLPCWEDLAQEERAERVRLLIQDIEEEGAERARDGLPVLGRQAILAADPEERPEKWVRSPAPLCHTVKKSILDGFRATLALVLDVYYAASECFRKGEGEAEFPEGTFRPHGGFVPWAESVAPT